MVISGVSGRLLAIDIDCVSEVIRAAEIETIGPPGETLLGYLNVRGAHIPAIDTASALGLPARDIQPSDRFVILEASGGRLAILVEDVASIADVVPLHTGAGLDGPMRKQGFTAAGRLAGAENRMVAIVDPERLGLLARPH